MAFSPSKLIFLVCILSLTHLSFSVTNVHDLLPQYNLPKGLLPSNIKSYTLSPDNSFTIELSSHPCYVKHNDQVVYYDKIIKGKLEYGKISDVSGIQAKEFVFWLSVTEITVGNNGNLVFHVGAVSTELPSKDFEDVLSCKANGLMIGSAAAVNDVHDLLPEYNLPKGLLPSDVKSYSLAADGSFTIELSSNPCYVKHNDQAVHYDKIIKGKLSYGKISEVSGIQAKEFIFWLSVTEITVGNNGMLVFHVGAVSTELPSKDFEDVLSCKAKGLMIGSVAVATATDVHDLLPVYNLPKGLLPSNIKSYSLAEDGSFTIELSSNPCYVKHKDQAVYYERIIKGKLAYGKITEVSGIQAKQFIFWLSVTEISVGNNGKLVFHVGALSTELPSKDFEDILSCKANGLMIESSTASVNDVHDLLPEFNLPRGLLPSDIKSYSLAADGSFTIELSSNPCYVKHNDQAVHYDRIIKGKLAYGKITQVSGIQAKQFIFWLSVTEISVGNNGKLVFHVGALSQELPVDDFATVLACKSNVGLRVASVMKQVDSI